MFRDPWRGGQAQPRPILHGQAFESLENQLAIKKMAAGTHLITSLGRGGCRRSGDPYDCHKPGIGYPCVRWWNFIIFCNLRCIDALS